MPALKAAGLVAAAGLSSRMGVFKPLLDMAGRPLICRTVESLLQGGAEQVIVVTGREHEAVTAALQCYPAVQTVWNRQYGQTAMFDSVKLGLEQLADCQALLFLPGDMPCIRPETVQLLLEQWRQTRPDVLFPTYQAVCCHPPVIAGTLTGSLLCDGGDGGLRGALDRLGRRVQYLPVPDLGCTLDADYQEDYQRLRRYWPQRYHPQLAQCQSFYQLAVTPEPVQQHCLAVAEKALAIGQQLLQVGVTLQLDLLKSAALLHDVCRTQADHAAAGAALLRRYGLEQAAQLVALHMDWPQELPIQLNEAAVLYLADKLVSGDRQIPLAERFAEKRKRYAAQPEILTQIERREQVAVTVLQLLEQHGVHAE